MNWGVLAYLFLGVKFVVTDLFRGRCGSPRAAYLTSVLGAVLVRGTGGDRRCGETPHGAELVQTLRVPPLLLLATVVFIACGECRAGSTRRRAVMAGGFLIVVLTVSVLTRSWAQHRVPLPVVRVRRQVQRI